MLPSHDDFPKSPKKVALQLLGKEIRQHLLGGTIHDIETLDLEPVFDEEVSNVNVPRIGTT
jgi:hypothetical protein